MDKKTILPYPSDGESIYGSSSLLTIDTVIRRERIEKLPEPKVVKDKSEVFDLERECIAAI